MSEPEDRFDRWLLMIHQLPGKPAYFRVKTWRRLQGIGAVGIKNSVYALPANEQTQEDFEWLRREIIEGGGEATICEARMLDGLTDEEIRGMFRAARDVDYEAIATEARELAAAVSKGADAPAADAKTQAARLRNRLSQVAAIDFFGANSRETAEGLISELEKKVREDADMPTLNTENPTALPGKLPGTLSGRVWVTRQGVQIDRIASAWLIRRFIDSNAVFKFVPGKGYAPQPSEIRFDMFEAEYTHEGDRCTFEVLLLRAELRDPALKDIAEIVHDIDLKDGKFERDEAAGIGRLIVGIAMAEKDDEQRIARGAEIFDGLYESFRTKTR
jgi:hypothetical protein